LTLRLAESGKQKRITLAASRLRIERKGVVPLAETCVLAFNGRPKGLGYCPFRQ
jgi:hypothetical protein